MTARIHKAKEYYNIKAQHKNNTTHTTKKKKKKKLPMILDLAKVLALS